jgi:hypothetical protein
MNMRILVLLIACVALPTLVQAADPAETATLKANRTALLQKLGPVGSTITSNNQQYQILPWVRATISLPDERPEQALTRVGGSKLIETKGAFVVFSTAQQSVPSLTSVNGATSYPAALNSRTGEIGFLPGTLKVCLKDMTNATAVAADHGLEVVHVFAHLQVAFFRVMPGQDVVAAAAELSADTRVASAEVEVVEHLNVPN